MLGAASHLPRRGASVLTIPGVSGVALTAATTGALVEYRWPAAFKLAGLLYFPTAPGVLSLGVAAGRLWLRIIDDDGDTFAFDTVGTATNAFETPGRAINGSGSPLSLGTELLDPVDGAPYQPRWFALERRVRAGETWRFQARNANTVTVTPFLGFRVEEFDR
jgi:hypothetical protein